MHVALTGGAHPLARLNELESAVGQPMQTWGGAFLYPNLYLMAGALLRSLAENQPFTDGNKRIAWAAAVVFLEINGITVEATEDAVIDMMLNLAAKQIDVTEIAEFFERHTSADISGRRNRLDG
ncbi:MAG: type II toxin-antitoxin system death-on-curing family toxin [Firmicutes bacterium]|nr:type II toxin-antitoxin system death-on-curing family toxin [Bacillota bacterium]